MNKVLVLVYVPMLEEEYDIFIPINKKVGTIKKLIAGTILELSGCQIKNPDEFKLYNKETGEKYDNNLDVKASGIANGSKLLLI
jgi:hypothetical protein